MGHMAGLAMLARRRRASTRRNTTNNEKQKCNAIQPVKLQVRRTEKHDRRGC